MSQAGSFGGGGGGATVNTLTGNTGGPISPVAGNINVVGDGTTVTVAGAGNTLTITALTNQLFHYTNVAATPYVVLLTDYYLSINTSALAITIQLPNAPAASRTFTIKDRTGAAGTRNITVTTVGGAVNIDGGTSYTMNTNFQAIDLIFNGVSYEIY